MKEKEILEALKLPHCSIFNEGVIVETPGNSVVHALESSFSITEVINQLIPNFSKFFGGKVKCTPESFRFGINHVDIKGALEEELHVHISSIIAIVVFGKGTAIFEKDGRVLKVPVSEGDVVVVPQNAPHYFLGEPRLIYTGIELGPIIDYQKHHYDPE